MRERLESKKEGGKKKWKFCDQISNIILIMIEIDESIMLLTVSLPIHGIKPIKHLII